MAIRLSLRERMLSLFNRLPVPILDAFANVLFGRALMVCNKYGIFDVLHASPQSVAGVGAKVGISVRGAEVILQAMEAGGYVKRNGTLFSNTALTEHWLTKSSPNYLGNLVRYFETLFFRWEFLGETVQRGDPRKPYFEFFSDEDWRTYTYGMMDLARILLPYVMKTVEVPKAARRLLDIGGSHGLYSIEMCKRNPELTAVVIDFEKAVEIGKTIAEGSSVSEQIVYRSGDFKKDLFGDGYDVAFAFNIIHGLKPSENESLMKKIAVALKGGGVLFIMDQLKDAKGTTPLARFIPAVVGVNLFNEIGGNTYTYHQIQGWCAKAGLVNCARKKIPIPGVSIVWARKP